ncbi:MAG: MerR family DNA-binding transcriptional regulator, partial [Hamadaea sp.]|nr:MerR family DNA-binding transcriptional regulator [Hamadaea sp.]
MACCRPANGDLRHTSVDAGVKVYRCRMRIGELADRAGTSARTLRYYE